MKKNELIREIENTGKHAKVKIAKDGEITGMLIDEDYRYHSNSNTGGRRYIGNCNDLQFVRDYS